MARSVGQRGYRGRVEWGPAGALAVGEGAPIVAVVDVLSFTTSLTVALDLGIEVFPYRWRDESAAEFARQHDATLAVARSQAAEGEVSLSPGTIRRSAGTRLVLPSPNGSTIAHSVARPGTTVIGVSLRNLTAAARWTARRLEEDPACWVAAIPAGERWPDGSLRPAVEDFWGAGGVLSLLDPDALSPEATAAVAAYRAASADLPGNLGNCASGRELVEAGWAEDVAIAGEVNTSASVPVLVDGRFLPAQWHYGEAAE